MRAPWLARFLDGPQRPDVSETARTSSTENQTDGPAGEHACQAMEVLRVLAIDMVMLISGTRF